MVIQQIYERKMADYVVSKMRRLGGESEKTAKNKIGLLNPGHKLKPTCSMVNFDDSKLKELIVTIIVRINV
jgi:hypothetical protein